MMNVWDETEYFFRSSKHIYVLFAHLFHQNKRKIHTAVCVCASMFICVYVCVKEI